MLRFLSIALLLMSLTFLGQARVEPFSCGSAVAYSNLSESGCQKGCCESSVCCKTPRAKEATPMHYDGGLMVSLNWVGSSISLSPPLLILPAMTGVLEPNTVRGHAPPVLATNCIRLI